jgi:hydrogenase nickel incorporation protein HypA/HybF
VHEVGLCESVLAAVERRAGNRPVSRVKLRVGVQHAVEPEAMRQAFELVSGGSVADGASLELVIVPAGCRCLTCAYEGDLGDVLALCPQCNSAGIEVSGGDELVLESLQYAAPDGGAAAPCA